MNTAENASLPLDRSALAAEITGLLAANRVWILATSSGDRVSARSMSIINDGLDIWFEMCANDLKGRQIRDNPRVALCWNNVQIEGRAEILGNAHAPEPANAAGVAWFCREYAAVHPDGFRRWSAWEGEVVVRVRPTLVTLWKYLAGEPFRDFLVPGERAWREAYL
jgi:hypothetical protein